MITEAKGVTTRWAIARARESLRVLFCIGVQQTFFAEPGARVGELAKAIHEASVGEHRLWRYLPIEDRVGRPLFFGNS